MVPCYPPPRRTPPTKCPDNICIFLALTDWQTKERHDELLVGYYARLLMRAVEDSDVQPDDIVIEPEDAGEEDEDAGVEDEQMLAPHDTNMDVVITSPRNSQATAPILDIDKGDTMKRKALRQVKQTSMKASFMISPLSGSSGHPSINTAMRMDVDGDDSDDQSLQKKTKKQQPGEPLGMHLRSADGNTWSSLRSLEQRLTTRRTLMTCYCRRRRRSVVV